MLTLILHGAVASWFILGKVWGRWEMGHQSFSLLAPVWYHHSIWCFQIRPEVSMYKVLQNFCFTHPPDIILGFFFFFTIFFKLLCCETDFSVYLAVFTCRMTKSGLGGYLMGYGNVAHALESRMLKVMCVALPWCQLSWRSSECIRFSVKARKLIQTQRKVMMSWHDVIMFMELSYWRSKLKINADCTLALPDVAASGLYSEIWRRRITAPCYSFAHSYNHHIHAEWLTRWINTLAPWRFAETNIWQTSPLLFARSGTVWEKPSNNRRTYWTVRAASIHICALLETRDTDSFKAHTCVFITV